MRNWIIPLFLMTSLYADPYQRLFEKSLQEGNSVQLSDGSIWEVLDDHPEYAEIARSWQKGDPLALEVHYRCDVWSPLKYRLKNMRTLGFLPIDSSCAERPKDPFIGKILELDPKGLFLSLSDGTEWKVPGLDTWSSYIWNEGDEVIYFKSDSNNYYLINLNATYGTVAAILSVAEPTKSKYPHYIQDILEDEKGSTFFIKLEDGFTWEVSQAWLPTTRAKIWQKGDEITLLETRKDGGWYVYEFLNKRTGTPARVYYRPDLGIGKYKTIVDIDPKGYWIILDDGSKWQTGWTYSWTSYYWKKGERVLVFMDGDSDASRYSLLNIDRYIYRNFVSATLENF